MKYILKVQSFFKYQKEGKLSFVTNFENYINACLFVCLFLFAFIFILHLFTLIEEIISSMEKKNCLCSHYCCVCIL